MMNLKLPITFLFFISVFLLHSQDLIHLETINATDEKVDIRVGEDYYSKGGWHLDPNTKPDVFSIGSKWNYDSLKVSFITDIDSIDLFVKPGKEYDFIINLNGKTPCYIKIVTAPNAIFLDGKKLLILLFIFSAILLIFIPFSKPNQINFLLRFGLWSPILFWVISFIGGHIQDNYDHSRSVISELGTLGSKGELFSSTAFILISIFSLLFSIGFYKASKKLGISKTPSLLSFVMALIFFWAGIFPLKNEFHSQLGASPLLIILAAFLGNLRWKKKADFLKIRNWSFISGLIMMLIFLRFVKPFGYEFPGLVQRFFYLGWSIWYIMLSLELTKKIKKDF